MSHDVTDIKNVNIFAKCLCITRLNSVRLKGPVVRRKPIMKAEGGEDEKAALVVWLCGLVCVCV